jgi:alpha-mannosidase
LLVARFIGVPQTGKLPATGAGYAESLPKNVVLQNLKLAEDGKGYVARFYEAEGRAVEVAWSGLPIKIRQAELTNLVEQPLRAAKVEDGKVRFSMTPWQMVTVRIAP